MPDAVLSPVATVVKETDPVLRALWWVDGVAGVEGRRGSPMYGLAVLTHLPIYTTIL